MKISFSPPDITEDDILAVTDALRSGWLTTGSKCKDFEYELSRYWMNGSGVAVVSSATAAMEIALRMLGVGSGDEVITTVYTYAATANVIVHVGAKPVFVDIVADGYNLDIHQVYKAITPKTKAIIAVDIGGYPCDYDALHHLVDTQKHLFTGLPNSRLFKHADRIAIIADAAHSLGACYLGRMSGSLADFSAFSFHAVKNLTTGEGGALSFRDVFGVDKSEIYKEIMLWSLHGQNKDALSKQQGNAWEYDILFSGYKCNMTDIMAALGLSQLKRYAHTLSKRRNLYQRYRLSLKGNLSIPHWDTEDLYVSSFHLALMSLGSVDVKKRNNFIKLMYQEGISCNVHFKPLILMQAFRYLHYSVDNFPFALNRYYTTVSLPLFSKMTTLEQDYIIEKLYKIYENKD